MTGCWALDMGKKYKQSCSLAHVQAETNEEEKKRPAGKQKTLSTHTDPHLHLQVEKAREGGREKHEWRAIKPGM